MLRWRGFCHKKWGKGNFIDYIERELDSDKEKGEDMVFSGLRLAAECCYNGFVEGLEYLYSHGYELSSQKYSNGAENYSTLLHHAAGTSNDLGVECCRFLLTHGCENEVEVRLDDYSHLRPIELAIMQKNIQCMVVLVSVSDLSVSANPQLSLADFALMTGNPDAARRIIAVGGPWDTSNIVQACCSYDSYFVDLALENGPPTIEAATRLLSSRDNVNSWDKIESILKTLIGAGLILKDKHEPLFTAIQKNAPLSIVKYLLDVGSPLYVDKAPRFISNSALHLALSYGALPIAKYILNIFPREYGIDDRGHTLLHSFCDGPLACQNTDDVCELLNEIALRCADCLNARDHSGFTAIETMFLCHRCSWNRDILYQLCDLGCDITPSPKADCVLIAAAQVSRKTLLHVVDHFGVDKLRSQINEVTHFSHEHLHIDDLIGSDDSDPAMDEVRRVMEEMRAR